MSSITSSKKEIIDFLWEWADTKGEWAHLLIDSIIKRESELDKQSRQLIFDHFLDSLRTTKQLPPLNLKKPQYTPSAKRVYIKTLRDVEGVNKLAKNQELGFSKNITTIYGENGSGKTGYGRILKSLGFSYDPNNTIYHNILSTPIPKAAKIDFESNGQVETFTWTGSNNHPELSKVSVFNSSCVQYSLVDRQLIVSPIGFHLFKLVTTELEELGILLDTKIKQHPIDIPWIDLLHPSTAQRQFIATLGKNATEQQLLQVAKFEESQEKELQSKEKELTDLNPTLLNIQLENLKRQIDELEKIKSSIKTVETALSDSRIESLKKVNTKIENLRAANQDSLKDIAEKNGIAFYDRKEFVDFIEAAERYIKILNKKNYPQPNDVCIYCKQELDNNAQELLRYYTKLLNDTTQENLKNAESEKRKIISELSSIKYHISLNNPIFGTTSAGEIIHPDEVTSYNDEIKFIIESITTKEITSAYKISFNFQIVLMTIENKLKSTQEIEKLKRESLEQISIKESMIKKSIEELKDRKLLSGRIDEIKNTIKNHKVVSLLRSKASEFNTASISKKTSEAREELIRQNFETTFHNELKSLRKSYIKVDLNFATTRGISKVTQKINNFSLTDILSEGEQKAIALAEFLTELQLDIVNAPVIFDDPVNSLDHKIIDEVAKRLIALSKTRQVIIFTHSILLLNSFIQQSKQDHHKQAGVSFAFHSVKSNFGETGIVGEVEEVNSHGYYKEKLNKVILTPRSGQDESKLAAEGYGHLRSIIEIMIEEAVFQGTIKRYAKGVAFPSLMRVKGDKLDQYKGVLNDIYEKCCVSIDGHSSPEEVHNTPTLAELKSDWGTVSDLRKQFNA